MVASGVLLTAAYWLLGGLPIAFAIWGVLGLAGLAAFWPLPDVSPEAEPPRPAAVAAAPPLPDTSIPDWSILLEGVPAPAMMLGAGAIVATANSRAQELLSVHVGEHISLAIRSPELIAALDEARRTRRGQVTDIDFNVPVERRLRVNVTPLAVDAAARLGPDLLLVFLDRTEEQQLTQLRADFVANASHELRTPLTSVKGFIETLQTTAKDDPKARERFLAIMHEQASRMSRLIDDLLSLSRVEMREHVAPRELIDVAELAEAVCKELEPLAQNAEQRLVLSFEARAALVRGDHDELTQVLQNLVQNAIKYGRTDGKVEVRITVDGSRIAIAVADDGIGIAPEHVPRLTERFYRVNARQSRERGGTGLGLAIVKHIVNRHRGELRVASTPGQGSTFTVLLPQADASPGQPIGPG